jgi:hypothetical protein
MSRALVPLRIPSGWAVVFNIFVEIGDGESVSARDVEAYLSDDILSIERVHHSDGRWTSGRGGWLIDLGWRAPGDPTGEYVLTVLNGGWDDPTAVFCSRRWRAVQQAINLTFTLIEDGLNIQTLSKAFHRLTELTEGEPAVVAPPR